MGMPDDFGLVVVLCPVEAVQSTAKDVFESVVNPAEDERADTIKVNDTNSTLGPGDTDGARYLCAVVMPAPASTKGLMAKEAYELHIWRQVVVDVAMMEKEVILEYDQETRYYYISSG